MKNALISIACAIALVIGSAAQSITGFRQNSVATGAAGKLMSDQVPVLVQTVPPWQKRALKLRAAPDDERVVLTVYLTWQHQSELDQLFRDQTDPHSSHYQQYLTPAQFHAAFSPKAEDVAAVEQALKGLGFHIEYVPESGLFVKASGTVAQIKQGFGVSQNLYSYRGKTLRAHAEEPTLPASLRGLVTYIAGLDDSRVMMRPSHVARSQRPDQVQSGSLQPPYYGGTYFPCSTYWGDTTSTLEIAGGFPYGTELPWIICGYTPQQIRAAYRADKVDQTGRGVTVAVTALYASPTLVADVNRYSANHGLPPLTNRNFQEILLPNVNRIPSGDPCLSSGWLNEQTLDVTAVHSMAPGASIIFVGGACEAVDELDQGIAVEPLYYAIDHRVADIVSNSWSWLGEADVSPGQLLSDTAEFIQAAIEGMSLMFASGDDGDLTQSGVLYLGYSQSIASGSWPATSPLVTSVGGTSLLLENAQDSKAEYGWASYTLNLQNPLIGNGIVTADAYQPPYWTWGGGGGPSLVMPEPSYQVGVVPTILATQTVTATGQIVPLDPPARVTPDIAMDADFDTGFLYGETFLISSPPVDAGCMQLTQTTEYCEPPAGGTSLATPLLAGVLALVNENRYSHHRGALGFINPALYNLQVGPEGSHHAPIIDVNAPSQGIAYLFGYEGINNYAGVGTIDSTIDSNGNIVENVDSSLKSAPGYDPVTGLGVPNAPAFINALSQ